MDTSHDPTHGLVRGPCLAAGEIDRQIAGGGRSKSSALSSLTHVGQAYSRFT